MMRDSVAAGETQAVKPFSRYETSNRSTRADHERSVEMVVQFESGRDSQLVIDGGGQIDWMDGIRGRVSGVAIG